MSKNIHLMLKIILVGGTVFAWFTIFQDFLRFQSIYGTIFRIKDCSIPNPVLTPCFYGGFGFILATILAFKSSFKWLEYLLIGCVIFAFGNLSYEIYKFYFEVNKVKLSCSGVETENIFTTPCFFGAMIFGLALFSFYQLKKELNREISKEKAGE